MICLPPRDTSPHQDSVGIALSGTPPPAAPTTDTGNTVREPDICIERSSQVVVRYRREGEHATTHNGPQRPMSHSNPDRKRGMSECAFEGARRYS